MSICSRLSTIHLCIYFTGSIIELTHGPSVRRTYNVKDVLAFSKIFSCRGAPTYCICIGASSTTAISVAETANVMFVETAHVHNNLDIYRGICSLINFKASNNWICIYRDCSPIKVKAIDNWICIHRDLSPNQIKAFNNWICK